MYEICSGLLFPTHIGVRPWKHCSFQRALREGMSESLHDRKMLSGHYCVISITKPEVWPCKLILFLISAQHIQFYLISPVKWHIIPTI